MNADIEAAWDGLVRHLEGVYDAWGVDEPGYRAAAVANAMRAEGWRIPLPPESRPPPLGRGADPYFRSQMAALAREAVRAARHVKQPA